MLGLLVVAVGIRAAYVGTDPFPLHDGGLFLAMIEELLRNGFALPHATAYNGDGIPFAYPPLGLYLVALASVATGAEPLTVMVRLPAALSAATVPVFYSLARGVTGSRRAAAFGALFFAAMPASFTWMIMGGGATRAPGYLLSIAAMAVTLAAFRSGARRTAALGGGLFGLAALGHPQFAWYAAAMLLVGFAGRPPSAATWRAGLVAALAALAVVTPWLGITVARHGHEPLLRAFATNGFADARREPTFDRVVRAQYEPVVGHGVWVHYGGAIPVTLGLVGVAASLWGRRPLAAAWLILLPLAGSRAGPQALAIPLACLCGVAAEAWWLIAARAAPALPCRVLARVGRAPAPRAARLGGQLVAAAGLLAVLVLQAHVALGDPLRLLGRLTADERASLRWVAEYTPPESRFAVMKPGTAAGWWDDRITEWFPALAQRTSVATPQGREWVMDFRIALRTYGGLQRCADATSACLDAWEARFEERLSHVYIPKDARPPRLRRSLDGSDDFELAYDGPAAWIYRRR